VASFSNRSNYVATCQSPERSSLSYDAEWSDIDGKGDVFGLVAMSDWFLTTMPIAVVIYFLFNPLQLAYVLNWVDGILH
jgi:hypothetical protein